MTAELFSWIQRSPLYVDAHREAVALPAGGGATWLDVGCGPGLMVRLASDRGFTASGVDASASMVAAARAQSPGLTFEVARLEALVGRASADVVSAASLLFVIPEREQALAQLWQLVAPGGQLLLVETTRAMTFGATLPRLGSRGWAALALWGLVRGGQTVAPLLDRFSPPGLAARSHVELLGGLVGAWCLRRNP